MSGLSDAQREAQRGFRKKYEAAVLMEALRVTSDPRLAGELAEQVLQEALARFPGGHYPDNYRNRLLGDVYLAYSGMTLVPETEDPPAFTPRHAAEECQTVAVQASLQIPAPAKPQSEEVREKAREAPPADEPSAFSAPVRAVQEVPAPPAVFDARETEQWVPEELPQTPAPHRSVPAASREAPPAAPEPPQRSIPHTIINTLLFLTCLAAGVYLLFRSGVLAGLV